MRFDSRRKLQFFHSLLKQELITVPRVFWSAYKVPLNNPTDTHNDCLIMKEILKMFVLLCFQNLYIYKNIAFYLTEISYECTRTQPSVVVPPPCWQNGTHPVCYNGGNATYEGNICWCICPPEWQGDSDCSLPTANVTNLPAGSSICEYLMKIC